MEHDVDLVLRVVGVGVDDVAGHLLGRVARGGGARLLPRGGVDGLPRGLSVARFLRGRLPSPGGSALLLWNHFGGHGKWVVVIVSVVFIGFSTAVLVGSSGCGVLILVACVFVSQVDVARVVVILCC